MTTADLLRVAAWARVGLVWYAIGDIVWRLYDGHGMLG